jgi:(1->4)-alpha-D-glucan 1-alpha-D-glucosylmutase
MLYQMIVAAWPLDLAADDADGLAAYRDRLGGWLEKAVREAKRRSEWAAPNEAYEAACRDFLAACLDPSRSAPLARELGAFAARIAPAGAVNALSQTLLRLTVPGVPDLYQGTEFWDFSLVDPDNRRPVDFDARRLAMDAGASPASLMETWRDGRIKQAIIGRALALRARLPALFARGKYQRLEVEGPRADNVLAFARIHEDRAIIAAITRLPSGLLGTAAIADETAPANVSLRIPAALWEGTNVLLPRSLAGRRMRDALGWIDDGSPEDGAGSDRLQVAELFAALPVALLEVG